MAFIIPNATETGSGQRFANVNQAEPDSLDFEALGLRGNWVRSGAAVSISTTDYLSVAAGVVVVGGAPYNLSAYGPVAIPRATDAYYALVVARKSGSAVSTVVINGTDSSTNPILPKSRSVLETDGLFNSSIHVDPATDVLLGAIYVTAAETTADNLVDKRIVDTRPVTQTYAALPTDDDKDVIGDIVIYDSSVYVKVNSTTWSEMATLADVSAAGVPVGAVFAWPGASAPTGYYLECNGAAVSRSTYSTLFGIIGTAFGAGDGSLTFNLPKLDDDRTIFGGSAGLVGATGGSNALTLTTANMPSHSHSVTVGNHAQLTHTSTRGLVTGTNNSDFNTDTKADHRHFTQEHQHTGAVIYRNFGDHNGFHVVANSSANHYSGSDVTAFHVDVIGINENSTTPSSSETDATETANVAVFKDGSNPVTEWNGAHSHEVTVGHHTISTHSVTQQTVGSGTAFNNRPNYLSMRWFIRYA